MKFGDVVACCDVDSDHMSEGKEICTKAQTKGEQRPEIETNEDYRKILDRKEFDIVTIVTPDHWHSKIAIEAMQAGKDIYCEKPLTLTINEGQRLVQAVKTSQRILQTGSQQRSDKNFRLACELVTFSSVGP